MGHGFEENLSAQALHFPKDGLRLAPLLDGCVEPFELFLGECDAHGLAFDLACPLVARPARSGTAILHVAFTDPTQVSQGLAQARILGLALLQGHFFLRWHEESIAGLSIGRYIGRPMSD